MMNFSDFMNKVEEKMGTVTAHLFFGAILLSSFILIIAWFILTLMFAWPIIIPFLYIGYVIYKTNIAP